MCCCGVVLTRCQAGLTRTDPCPLDAADDRSMPSKLVKEFFWAEPTISAYMHACLRRTGDHTSQRVWSSMCCPVPWDCGSCQRALVRQNLRVAVEELNTHSKPNQHHKCTNQLTPESTCTWDSQACMPDIHITTVPVMQRLTTKAFGGFTSLYQERLLSRSTDTFIHKAHENLRLASQACHASTRPHQPHQTMKLPGPFKTRPRCWQQALPAE